MYLSYNTITHRVLKRKLEKNLQCLLLYFNKKIIYHKEYIPCTLSWIISNCVLSKSIYILFYHSIGITTLCSEVSLYIEIHHLIILQLSTMQWFVLWCHSLWWIDSETHQVPSWQSQYIISIPVNNACIYSKNLHSV